MSQQLESGNVQPNVNPSLQSNHESWDLQPIHVDPSLQPNHKSGGEQPNVNPFLQPNKDSGDVQLNVNHSLQPNCESGGEQPNANPSLQPNRGSGGDQLNANPSLQPNHDNMQSTGISEEPQLSQPQSAGGNAHQPKSFGPTEIWTGKDLERYRPLYLAAQRGDWATAKSFIDKDPNALTVGITPRSKTVLHVAALCCQWGFVLKLLERLPSESIVGQTQGGSTVLHYVAEGGNLKTAKALVQKNPDLLQILDNDKYPPLLDSIYSESNKEMAWYLSRKTKDQDVSPRILCNLINSGYHDIAWHFVQKIPKLALEKDEFGHSLLYWLATNPSCFFSGSNLGFLERWIYKFVHVEIKNTSSYSVMVNMEESTEGQPRSLATQVLQWFKTLLRKAIAQLVPPSVKKVRDAKLKHEYAVELVTHVCKQLYSMNSKDIDCFLGDPEIPILGSAVKFGIEELVRTVLQHFPEIIYHNVLYGRNILQAAIEYRQEKIVNIIKEISPTTTKNLCSRLMESGNTTLHLTGRLAPAFKLFSVSGAALQMQRELQWFKEVENITYPYLREASNNDKVKETAKEVFRNQHKGLVEQGEKWMKDTAKSCMLVSTLIATVLFAAAFTTPGGNNNDNGIPFYLQTNVFTVFAISNALGLFSSLTSLLMFLAILTAQYEVEDFLESLPKKLIIGLGSLFIAIATMIIAFGAALTIVLNKRWHLVSLPITVLASFPVAIFVIQQLPLFIQMVQSTYGASIFRPWPSRV